MFVCPDESRRKPSYQERACLLDALDWPSYAFVVVALSLHNPFACSVIQT